jgi:AmpD protein
VKDGPAAPPGWVRRARRVVSPNCDDRPAGTRIELLVIHNISLPPGGFDAALVEALFTNRLDPRGHPFFATLAGLRVSAHFVIDRAGAITQFVDCERRAWHAGVSSFEGRPRCNDFSIGIELIGSDFVAFEAEQYRALARLTRTLRGRWPLRAVRGHQHIAPMRKTDPGPHFDWRGYARAARLPASMLPTELGRI